MRPLTLSSKSISEKFLKDLQLQGVFPPNFSGFIFPRMGKYQHIWQFHRNKLVGAIAIHVNNVDNLVSKVQNPLDLGNLVSVEDNGNDINPD